MIITTILIVCILLFLAGVTILPVHEANAKECNSDNNNNDGTHSTTCTNEQQDSNDHDHSTTKDTTPFVFIFAISIIAGTVQMFFFS